MPVELWFPLPIMVVDVEDAAREATRTKARSYLESERGRQDVAPSPAESVRTSYYKPELSVLADAKLAELEGLVLQTGRTFVEGMGIAPMRLEVERSWINVFRPGAQEAQHSHDGSILSCSYYVDAPENCGQLVFPDPVPARRVHRAFSGTGGSSYLLHPDVAFTPKAGRLIMFESWVEHSVMCNKSDRPRVSIAINLRRAR